MRRPSEGCTRAPVNTGRFPFPPVAAPATSSGPNGEAGRGDPRRGLTRTRIAGPARPHPVSPHRTSALPRPAPGYGAVDHYRPAPASPHASAAGGRAHAPSVAPPSPLVLEVRVVLSHWSPRPCTPHPGPAAAHYSSRDAARSLEDGAVGRPRWWLRERSVCARRCCGGGRSGSGGGSARAG